MPSIQRDDAGTEASLSVWQWPALDKAESTAKQACRERMVQATICRPGWWMGSRTLGSRAASLHRTLPGSTSTEPGPGSKCNCGAANLKAWEA